MAAPRAAVLGVLSMARHVVVARASTLRKSRGSCRGMASFYDRTVKRWSALTPPVSGSHSSFLASGLFVFTSMCDNGCWPRPLLLALWRAIRFAPVSQHALYHVAWPRQHVRICCLECDHGSCTSLGGSPAHCLHCVHPIVRLSSTACVLTEPVIRRAHPHAQVVTMSDLVAPTAAVTAETLIEDAVRVNGNVAIRLVCVLTICPPVASTTPTTLARSLVVPPCSRTPQHQQHWHRFLLEHPARACIIAATQHRQHWHRALSVSLALLAAPFSARFPIHPHFHTYPPTHGAPTTPRRCCSCCALHTACTYDTIHKHTHRTLPTACGGTAWLVWLVAGTTNTEDQHDALHLRNQPRHSQVVPHVPRRLHRSLVCTTTHNSP
jgi:hypothetical protein